jgi:ribonucleoside-triphosphate reductase (thioredoxin)
MQCHLRRGISSLKLPHSFLSKYNQSTNPFDALGQIAYIRTYSRLMPNGVNECWFHTVRRAVEGVYSILERHCDEQGIKFNPANYMDEACDFFHKIYNCEFLPSGRCLWALGSPIIESKHLNAALNNCAFVSTASTNQNEFIRVLDFTMDALMLGIGVGFDTKGSDVHKIYKPQTMIENFAIPDSREGWVESMIKLLQSYLLMGKPTVQFDYSKIRKKGTPLKVFGGVASGYIPLKEMHEGIRQILNNATILDSTTITDLINLIGKCVVSGNIRRSALIALGNSHDHKFLQLKNYTINPHRKEFGWTSNNSLYVNVGEDYSKYIENIKQMGEPGFAWLENMRAYGRTSEPKNYKDVKAMGGNPCFEQTLESFELCCLVEVFLNKYSSAHRLNDTIQSAFTFAKYVSLANSHWKETNEVIKRNRRIGCSLSGIAGFLESHSEKSIIDLMELGYKTISMRDKALSKSLQVSESIKTTSIKPSGTISLLAGCTPGIHFPDSNYYIRRVRLSDEMLCDRLKKSGYKIEEDRTKSSAFVVEIPMHSTCKTYKTINIEEQLHLVDVAQKYWADNQVSCTIRVKENEWASLPKLLSKFDSKLKGISFIPFIENKIIYDQAPYEEINESYYQQMVAKIAKGTPLISETHSSPEAAMFCDTDTCDISNYKNK